MRSGQSQLESQVEAAGARSIYVVHRARFLLFPFLKIDEWTRRSFLDKILGFRWCSSLAGHTTEAQSSRQSSVFLSYTSHTVDVTRTAHLYATALLVGLDGQIFFFSAHEEGISFLSNQVEKEEFRLFFFPQFFLHRWWQIWQGGFPNVFLFGFFRFIRSGSSFLLIFRSVSQFNLIFHPISSGKYKERGEDSRSIVKHK